jgi:hypothetical protein
MENNNMPIEGQGQGQAPPEVNQPPAQGAVEGQPPAQGGQEQGFEFLGQKFHNDKHAERIIADKLDKLATLEAKMSAYEQSEMEKQRDSQLMSTVKNQNPEMTDDQIRRMVEQQKEIYSQVFSTEKQRLESELGNIALNNYFQQAQVAPDIAAGIQAVYQQPEIARLVNTKDQHGRPLLSFDDLRDWAEAPVIKQRLSQLEAELSAYKNGAVSVGAQGSGVIGGNQGSAGEPPINDYEALKKWKAANVGR